MRRQNIYASLADALCDIRCAIRDAREPDADSAELLDYAERETFRAECILNTLYDE